jgi:serralysin
MYTAPQLDIQYNFIDRVFSFVPPSEVETKSGIIVSATAEAILRDQGYAVDKIFNDPINDPNSLDVPLSGYQAVGLKSIDGTKPPVLYIPGGFVAEPGSPGLKQFSANKQAIQDWLVSIANNKEINPNGFKPDVTGSSRGGAFTQQIASEYPTLIGSAVSFVSTGIDEKTANKFTENGGNPDQVRHYIVDGDYRSLWGEAFIPGKVIVSSFETPLGNSPASFLQDYAATKHSSSILADFSSLFPDTTDPNIAQFRALTDIPAGQTLSEISVDDLNQPDFSFQSKDWQEIKETLAVVNPNVASLYFGSREDIEEWRYTAPLDERGFVFFSRLPVTPDEVNQPTAKNDVLFGTDGDDLISGFDGNDYIQAGDGDDAIFGNAGRDGLAGRDGDDILSGGADDDLLTGGRGNDLFLFGDSTPFSISKPGVDRINDFVIGEDVIGLSKATFTNLGDNFATVFGIVTDDAAADISADLIIQNTSNGKLYYNTNGAEAGFGEGGQFANIFGQPVLSAENFVVI